MGRAAEHPDDCHCGDCHPFAPGSEAERRWLAGDRTDATREPLRPRVLPGPASYTLPVLPGDLDVLAARVECARALGLPVPSRLGSSDEEEPDGQDH